MTPTKKSKARRLHRTTADRAYAGFLERLAQVNAPDAPYAYRVTTVVLFGSYATDAAQVGDVDLAVGLTPRYPHNSPEQNALEQTRFAVPTRPRFRNIVERIFWPQLEVLQALKASAATLSLHELRELDDLQPTPAYRVVHGMWEPKRKEVKP